MDDLVGIQVTVQFPEQQAKENLLKTIQALQSDTNLNLNLGLNLDLNNIAQQMETLKQSVQSVLINNDVKIIDDKAVQEQAEVLSKSLEQIKAELSQLGQVKISSNDIDKVSGEFNSFIATVKEADGVIEKFKYDANAWDNTLDNPVGYQLTGQSITDNSQSAEIKAREELDAAIQQTINEREEESRLLEQNQAKAINSNLEDEYKLRTEIIPKIQQQYEWSLKNLELNNQDAFKNSGLQAEAQTFRDTLNNLNPENFDADKIANGFKNIQYDVKETNVALKESSGYLDVFGDSFSRMAKNIASFAAIMLPIQFFNNTISNVSQLDDQLTRLKLVMNNSDSAYQQFTNDAINMSNALGGNVKDALSASQVYANLNESMGDIVQRTQASIVMSNLTGASAQQTSAELQKMGEQYSIAGDQMMSLVDKITKVSASLKVNFADAIQQSSQAIALSGSVAKNAKLSYDDLLADVATLIEKTGQSGDVVGHELGSLIARTYKVKSPDSSENLNESDYAATEKAFNDLGVSLRQQDGEWKSFNEITAEASKNLANMSDQQRSFLAQQDGSIRGMNAFITLMENQNEVTDLTTKSQQSQGFAMKENETEADSLKGHLNVLSNEFMKLSTVLVNSSELKFFVDLGTGIIDTQIAFGKLNLAIVPLILVYEKFITAQKAATLATEEFKITSEIGGVGKLASDIGIATKALLGFEVSEEGATVSATALNVAMSGLMLGLPLIIEGIGFLISKHQQQKQSVDDVKTSYQNLLTAMKNNDVSGMQTEYDKLESKEKELQDLMKKRDDLQNKLQNSSEGAGMSQTSSQLNSVNAQIDTLQKELDGAGVSVDKLKEAKDKIDMNATANDIKNVVKVLDDGTVAINSNKDATSQYIDTLNTVKTTIADCNKVLDEHTKSGEWDLETIMNLVKQGYPQLLNCLGNDKAMTQQLTDIKNQETQSVVGSLENQINAERDAINKMADIYGFDVGNFADAQSAKNEVLKESINKRIQMYNDEMKIAVNAYNTAQTEQDKMNAQLGMMQIGDKMTGVYGSQEEIDTKIDSYFQAKQIDANLNKYLTDVGASTDDGKKGNADTSSSSSSGTTITPMNPYTAEIQSNNEELTQAEKNLTNLENVEKNYASQKDYQNALKTENQLLQDNTSYQTLLQNKLKEANSMKSEVANTLSGMGITTEDMTSQTKLEQIYDQRYATGQKLTTQQAAQAQQLKDAIDDWKSVNDQIDNVNQKLDDSNTKLQDTQNTLNQLQESQLETFIQQSVYDGQTKQDWTDANNIKIKGLQDQLSLLQQQNTAQQQQNDLMDMQNQLIQDQTDLQNIQDNKTVQVLQQQADGSWNYTYTYDESKYQSAQDKLTKDQDAYNKQVLSNQEKEQQDSIQSQIQALQDEAQYRSDSYDRMIADTQAAFGSGANPSPTSLLGIWSKSLDTLNQLTDSKMTDLMNTIQSKLSSISVPSVSAYSGSGGSPSSSSSSSSSSGSSYVPSTVTNPIAGATYTPGSNSSSYTVTFNQSHANGTTNADAGLSLVGEQGAEMRILNQGDGIIPADMTKNLWTLGANASAIMNSIYQPKIAIPNLGNINSKTQGTVEHNYNITANFPNVESSSEIKDALLSFDMYAHQQASARR